MHSTKRENLVKSLIKQGIIKSKIVEKVFTKVPRDYFVPNDERENAHIDTPLPLFDTKQTISAPHMVAIMLEALELSPGQKILEVGCGSGYSAALTAEIVGKTGSVISIERIHYLVNFAKRNLDRSGYSNRVNVILGDGSLGYPPKSEEPLYDRIVVTAAASHVPLLLKKQVKKNGFLLIPVGGRLTQTLKKIKRLSLTEFKTFDICECIFVPLINSINES